MKYCEERNLDIHKIMPLTIFMQYNNPTYDVQIQNFSYLFNNMDKYVGLNLSLMDQHMDKNTVFYNTLFSLGGRHSKIGLKSKLYIPLNHYGGNNLWLVKAPDLNRGRCIKIGNNLKKIEELIKRFHDGIIKEFKSDNEDDEKEIENSKFIIPLINLL